MANYDFSKPAPDRTHRRPLDTGTGIGGLAFILGGVALLAVVLYSVFGAALASDTSEPAAAVAPAD